MISRSRGILKSARLLSNEECIKLLSNVRLGITLGEIQDVTLDTVNELMTDLQPATLMKKRASGCRRSSVTRCGQKLLMRAYKL